MRERESIYIYINIFKSDTFYYFDTSLPAQGISRYRPPIPSDTFPLVQLGSTAPQWFSEVSLFRSLHVATVNAVFGASDDRTVPTS